MDTPLLFAAALGLTEPWFVAGIDFDPDEKHLLIRIDFRRGGTFTCPDCGGADRKPHDTSERRWRHLDFFQHKTELVARVPRISCSACGVRVVAVPWARPGSGFTNLFEALVLTMAPHMPLAAIARLVGEHDTRLWRILDHHVTEARSRRQDSGVRCVGIDETAARRGHDYISLFMDVEGRPRLLFATEGRDHTTVQRFSEDLVAHGGAPGNIEEICVDMSPAFIKGITEEFPRASVTFDRFHVQQLVNVAVDETRRDERRADAEARARLKGHRYTMLRNESTLSDDQMGFLAELLTERRTLKTARAYHLKVIFQEFYDQPKRQAASYLKRWCDRAVRSRLPAMVKAAKTIRKNFAGILRWFESQITNGILEGINSLIQAAKAKARGYRTTRNLIIMSYLIAGQLEFSVPHFR